MNRRNFTSRKRVLPKVVAIGFVFSILLLFQYGSHIFNSITDDIEDDIRSSDVLKPIEDNVKPVAKPGNIDVALSENDLKETQSIDDMHESELSEAPSGNTNLAKTSRHNAGDQGEDGSQEYQLNLDHCKIPKLEIRSKNYIKYEKSSEKVETCENEEEISRLEREFSILEDGVSFTDGKITLVLLDS